MRNALSIDFEDWYQPFAARGVDGWQNFPSRVPSDTSRLLAVLAKYNVRCTFFVLGEVAEKFPDEIRAIHKAGHEIGSHGYRHLPLYEQQQDQFEKEMRGSLDFLQQLTGEPVLGFRAPFFSIREGSLWAIDSLHKLGLKYDSSINPIAGAFHGYRGGGREPYVHPNGLKEFPITTYRLSGMTIPFGGGMYYRLLPYALIRAGLKRLNRQNIAGNIYFHPREFDPHLPRLKSGLKLKLIVYAGTAGLEAKLERLLQDFEFIPMREL
ncbi:MAG TPA: polysaccharide deacetylase family protein [Tepidisphaeraceae bacterium]|nr:polysaccharide deacetylase family protein [Tepidisphaeraceae bacterium]